MAAKTIAERIGELEARKKALVARLSRQERARDTRRKILLGALVLHRLENEGTSAFNRALHDWLKAELPGFLVRDGDRALFDDIIGNVPAQTPAPAPAATASEQEAEQ